MWTLCTHRVENESKCRHSVGVELRAFFLLLSSENRGDVGRSLHHVRLHRHRHTDTQTHRHIDTQTHRHTDTDTDTDTDTGNGDSTDHVSNSQCHTVNRTDSHCESY